MVQVKKKQVRQAILDSAYDLFSERGYNSTTLQEIAERAGVGVSSLYSYFPSKIHLLYAVVEPWTKEAFDRLEERVKKQKTPRDKLSTILLGVWRDVPMENLGLANSHMEALASADPKQQKPAPLLKWVEERLMMMLASALPESKIDYEVLPNLFMMAYDGFVINRRLNDLRDIERVSNAMCDILLGPAKP
ncbi:TetR/AcrR family transcriptional regulator [Pseudolabrys taiwanensis]|uniref:TetR/AcrR family transcriptional regulator n=1 Tax=Pseudolabrys taiwanensis TaxID=331696 RepID=UPI0013B385FE|nr:TetR/AcrR family transcriptional regulator [Pseudolabrys taiwanensis]